MRRRRRPRVFLFFFFFRILYLSLFSPLFLFLFTLSLFLSFASCCRRFHLRSRTRHWGASRRLHLSFLSLRKWRYHKREAPIFFLSLSLFSHSSLFFSVNSSALRCLSVFFLLFSECVCVCHLCFSCVVLSLYIVVGCAVVYVVFFVFRILLCEYTILSACLLTLQYWNCATHTHAHK